MATEPNQTEQGASLGCTGQALQCHKEQQVKSKMQNLWPRLGLPDQNFNKITSDSNAFWSLRSTGVQAGWVRVGGLRDSGGLCLHHHDRTRGLKAVDKADGKSKPRNPPWWPRGRRGGGLPNVWTDWRREQANLLGCFSELLANSRIRKGDQSCRVQYGAPCGQRGEGRADQTLAHSASRENVTGWGSCAQRGSQETRNWPITER